MAISNADYAREAGGSSTLSKTFNPATSVPAGEACASPDAAQPHIFSLPPIRMRLLLELSATLVLISSAAASPATTAPRLSGRPRRLLVHTPPSPHGLASNFARAVFPGASFFAAASVPGYTVPSLLAGAPVGVADGSAAGDTEGADGADSVDGGCFDVAVVTYDHDPPPCSHSYIFLNGEGGYPGHLPPHSLVLGPPFSTAGTATHLWVPYASTSFAERLDIAPAFRRAVAARRTRKRTGKDMRRGRRREDKDVTPKKRLSLTPPSSPPPPPRRRFAVYLSSRCFGHREAFFDALHARAIQVRRGRDAG